MKKLLVALMAFSLVDSCAFTEKEDISITCIFDTSESIEYINDYLNHFEIYPENINVVKQEENKKTCNLLFTSKEDYKNLIVLSDYSNICKDNTITFTNNKGEIVMDQSVLKEKDGVVLNYEDGIPTVTFNIADTQFFKSITGKLAGSNLMAWIGYEEANEQTGYIGDFAAYNGLSTVLNQINASKKIIINATVNEAIDSEVVRVTGSFSNENFSVIDSLISASYIISFDVLADLL